MHRLKHQVGTLTIPVPRQILSIRCLFLLGIASCAILWFESTSRDNQYTETDLVNEALKNVANDLRYYELYRHPNKLPRDLKYILLWTPYDYSPFYQLGKGQRAFIEHNCSSINCYITTDRKFLGGDVTKFDAIAFNGRNIHNLRSWDLPQRRSPHQKYIFVITESADNYPVCDEKYDDFFNWTYTYRLDSTIRNQYIIIKNKYDEIVGPRKDMEWVDMTAIDEELPYIHNKTKAAAWFVSNCDSRNNRNEFVKKLQHELSLYGLTIDIYGNCGTLRCPKWAPECFSMLEKNYYFYLALENSFDEDYITEKVLTAFHHNTVPIVYGGANYSMFLPPHSYLDGRKQTPKQLAATMAKAIESSEEYQRFFWWKRHYSYPEQNSYCICSLCSTLSNSSMFNTYSVYKNFREYWNPNYKKRC
ncbi:alpha-(1,3)-fucosyltransferase C-like [Amyelois transitella]|uniref:alpha-(1,3)-fucosyltransferase C-like n=1 Tax=Amyelois transitella TaxID=680683 RepID=UPI0029901C16|nr:alpha-(1,3)-fucosyltransferase C-like [Amyelois transitella]XP_060806205.1 alpha-(1,3)-fucosyltransferase C-like [Amyelois transitella]XP_060806206.1 alpha-(1,3)-fucosyltransferase C-like [Amyelois transitella]XP_060806207.1 alpha-(1,3)-fucosyltransferase C-like [Amyelois transitella]